MRATLRVPVDLHNPAQFYACCGLLDLAERAWSDVIAWFDGDMFVLEANDGASARPVTIDALLAWAMPAPVSLAQGEDPSDLSAAQLLGPPLNLRLDWWRQPWSLDDNRDLKLWAGQLSSGKNLGNVWIRFARCVTGTGALLDRRDPIAGGEKARFGLDPRSGWTALDLGFSPNNHSTYDEVIYAPTEALAAIGLEGVRPWSDDPRLGFRAWTEPMPPILARWAASCSTAPAAGQQFVFSLVVRGKNKCFSYAEKKES